MLHLGYKIEDATSYEVDGSNNDDEAMPRSVGQDYHAILFTDYRCNGKIHSIPFYQRSIFAFAKHFINLTRNHCRGKPSERINDGLFQIKCRVLISPRQMPDDVRLTIATLNNNTIRIFAEYVNFFSRILRLRLSLFLLLRITRSCFE